MRSVFALGLLISLCGPVSAATAHHPRTHHHVIVRPSQSVVVPPAPIPPGENRNLDPSTWGGTCSGCAGKKRGDGGVTSLSRRLAYAPPNAIASAISRPAATATATMLQGGFSPRYMPGTMTVCLLVLL